MYRMNDKKFSELLLMTMFFKKQNKKNHIIGPQNIIQNKNNLLYKILTFSVVGAGLYSGYKKIKPINENESFEDFETQLQPERVSIERTMRNLSPQSISPSNRSLKIISGPSGVISPDLMSTKTRTFTGNFSESSVESKKSNFSFSEFLLSPRIGESITNFFQRITPRTQILFRERHNFWGGIDDKDSEEEN